MMMHEGEIDIDEELVGRLIAAQFPDMADLPISAVPSAGTVNAIYRLGDHLYARLPRVGTWAHGLVNELAWLPKLAAHVWLRIPEPVATGEPTSWYPFTWAIYQWIQGHPYQDDLVDDERQAAGDLARFVRELRGADTSGAPPTGRRPLRELDTVTRKAIESSRDVIDSEAATVAWEHALQAPEWTGAPQWIHTDLLRPNLLVDRGRICAVIDFGGVGIGDPAADVIAAWSVFSRPGRAAYQSALDVDDGTWNRGRGYALHQAALIIPYYAETNPDFVASAVRTVEQVLADSDWPPPR